MDYNEAEREPGFDTGIPSSSGGIVGSSPFGSKSLDDMVSDATPNYGVDKDKVVRDVADIQRKKNEATDKATNSFLGDMNRDRAMMRDNLAGIGPASDIKDWNADKERQDRVRSPMETFGSAGTIFAVLASAFTRTPMTNALNGAAAAMTAAKDADESNYDKAFDAFKKNSELALKRHEIQREAYADAQTLLKTDMVAGEAAMRATASRFEDKKMSALLDNGYLKEALDLEDKRVAAARGLIGVLPKLQEMDMQRQIYKLDPRSQSEDPNERRAALQSAKDGNLSPAQDIYQQAIREKPNMTVQEKLDLKNDLTGKNDIDTQVWEQYKEEHPNATAEEMLAFRKQLKDAGKGGSANSSTAAREEIRQQYITDWKEKNPGKTPDATVLAAANAAAYRREVTANRADDINSHINLIDENLNVIEKVKDIMSRNVASAGLTGKVLRGTERVRDIFGSNDSDRNQMESYINYLRLNGTRLLSESKGRPLAAEASKIDSIIRGLNWGDVTVNTVRSLEELEGIYERSRQGAVNRLPTGTPSGAGASATPPQSSGSPAKTRRSWRDDPVVPQ